MILPETFLHSLEQLNHLPNVYDPINQTLVKIAVKVAVLCQKKDIELPFLTPTFQGNINLIWESHNLFCTLQEQDNDTDAEQNSSMFFRCRKCQSIVRSADDVKTTDLDLFGHDHARHAEQIVQYILPYFTKE